VPVVFVQVGGVARSGHLYDDREGVAYEYPTGRYERLISQGDRFVYQVPKVGYTGCGVIGEIQPSVVPKRLVCELLSVRRFKSPASLKDESGRYFEADPTYWKGNVYWGQGVRPLSNERFDAIVRTAGDDLEPLTPEDVVEPEAGSYANSVDSRMVEQYAVDVVRNIVAEKYGAAVKTMPRNNPGFDLLVGSSETPVRYVEVKGTRSTSPVFFLSEGERQFSIKYSHLYTIIVVSGINLLLKTHEKISTYNGAVQERDFVLRPRQWRGELLHPTEEISSRGSHS
jgi:hypothetical protein